MNLLYAKLHPSMIKIKMSKSYFDGPFCKRQVLWKLVKIAFNMLKKKVYM